MITMNLSTGMDQNERRWVSVFALAVILLTMLPYLIGYSVQGADWRFTGFVIGVEDGNSYIAKMLSGSMGEWLFRSPYTAYPQQGVLTYIPYYLLGKLAASPGLHEQNVALYHLFRMISVYLVVKATYDLIAFFVSKVLLRRLGLALVILGGGLGWLLLLAGREIWLGSLPLEFYSPESFGFLALFSIPHLAIGRALMLWGLLALLRAGEMDLDGKSTLKNGLKIGLFWLGTGLVQPLTGMIAGAVAGIYLFAVFLWQGWLQLKRPAQARWMEIRKRFALAFVAGLIALPWVAYNFLALNQDPFLKRWTAQNILPSPHPFHYLLAYGLVAIPALVGAIFLVKTRPWSGWLPAAWVAALPFLAYTPTTFQRRLPEGVWVALIILAMTGLEQIEQRYPRRSVARWFRLSMAFAFPSSLVLVLGALIAVLNPAIPVFRPVQEIAAFTHLADTAQNGQVVLASFETGNALPAWTPLRVLIGHGPESVNQAELEPRVAQFYQTGTPDAERQALLNEFQVSFVFWGPAERSLGDWQPDQASYLEPNYLSGDYAIFSVRQD